MSIPMEPYAEERLRNLAGEARQTSEEYLQEAIDQALARHRSMRRAQLTCDLSGLFRTFTPEEVTTEAARRMSRD